MTVPLASPALSAKYQLKAIGVSVVTAVEPDVQDMTPPAIVSGNTETMGVGVEVDGVT
jgi:hypothetical protein